MMFFIMSLIAFALGIYGCENATSANMLGCGMIMFVLGGSMLMIYVIELVRQFKNER